MSEFKPGQALLNKSAWEKDLTFLQENGIVPKAFAKRAIGRGTVCYFDSYYYSKNKEPVFNNQKYASIEALVDKYRHMDESKVNYKGIEEHSFIFEEKLKEYLELGIMRKATQYEIDNENIWINPLNCIKISVLA